MSATTTERYNIIPGGVFIVNFKHASTKLIILNLLLTSDMYLLAEFALFLTYN